MRQKHEWRLNNDKEEVTGMLTPFSNKGDRSLCLSHMGMTQGSCLAKGKSSKRTVCL